MARDDPGLEPGDTLAGKYVLRERIGAGGMGVVFVADQAALARRVAIKILHPHLATQAVYLRRFRDEARAASRVQHHGSVTVVDLDTAANGTPFLVMELVPGRPLGQILREEVLPLQRALGIFDQILEVLDAAHARSVVHADVKSDNFLIDQQASGDAVTLIDFGLARLDGAPFEPGFLAGTPEYTAPELVCGGSPTIASDLYGAGMILYELLTGRTPFAGCSSVNEILRRQIDDAVIPPSSARPDRDLPSTLDEIVRRALDKDPRGRFASAGEFRNALEAVWPDLGTSMPPGRRALEVSAELGGLPLPAPGHIAHGSDLNAVAHDGLRRAIASALVRGDIPEIARAYAALAAELVRERHLRAAIDELEEGIDVITTGRGPSGADVPEPVSRLVASLAALYELAGDPGRARRVLASADGRATMIEWTSLDDRSARPPG